MCTVTISAACMVKSNSRYQGPPMRMNSPSSLSSIKSISKASSLKISSRFRASAMAVCRVKLVGPEGEEHEFDAPDDTYILDAVETVGVKLPYSGRVGACCTCAGCLEFGKVDQSDGSFLDEA